MIPRNHIRAPGSKAASAFSSSTGAGSGSASGAKALSSLVPPAGVSFQPTSSSSASSSQAAGKKGLSSNVRQPFPVSLPLAYTHPQLALLAAHSMHQIRHPRLPMAQFGGTFSPTASTWGPFPVRPVSPGSANGSPKHNGGGAAAGAPGAAGVARPNSTHGEHGNPASSVPVAASIASTTNASAAVAPNTPTAAGSPHPTNPTPYNPQPSNPTPSSVRKQLFTADPKPSGATPVSVATALSGATNAVRGAGSPAHHNSTATSTLAPQQTVGLVPQPHIQPSKPEPGAVSVPSKDKLPLPAENQTTSVAESISSAGFTSSAMTLPAKPEPRQQPPAQPPSAAPTSEAPVPPLLNPQHSAHLPAAPPPVLSHNVAHPNNTVPHFSAPAPRVSHRMQPPGPYYSLAEQQQTQQQQQQSVFVPFNAQQEPPKQTPNQAGQPANLPPQAQAQGSLQVSANLGMMNGSQMQHVASTGKPQQIPTNFGPAGLFNFSSIFENNNQVWSHVKLPVNSPPSYLQLCFNHSRLTCQVGNNQVWPALHLPARSPPEQSYSAPPAFVSMGQMENMMPPPPPDSSKAPGYRSASQRMVNSSIGTTLSFFL